ncbi:MAG TPA: hypothetical protein PK668_26685 [Myxococcota bacterium]|nr:hypothetical protein [Myxococcota bacterium]HSA23176.1 hypothetical protein [Myxococcota bacterium]
MLALACLLVSGACERTESPRANPTLDGSGVAAPAPVAAEARPTPILLLNTTERPVRLDSTYGVPISILPRRLELDPLFLDLPNPNLCPPGAECAKPRPIHEDIPAGESLLVEWNGRVNPGGQAPPPGRYILRVCDEAGSVCGRSEVELPATEIRLALAVDMRTSTACPLEDYAGQRVARTALRYATDPQHLGPEAGACDPGPARCVGPDELDRTLEALRSAPCSLLLVPRGRELEGRFFFPRPKGAEARESVWVKLDLDGALIEDVGWTYAGP